MAKSDDSKRQDAEAAAKANTSAPAVDGGQLLDQLQGKAAEKREAGDPAGASQIELALKMAAQAMALAERSQAAQEDRLQTLERRGLLTSKRLPKLLKCPTCHQALWDSKEKRGVCNGSHVRVYIAPSNHSMWRWFQGCTINGVRYLGRCDVPLVLVDQLRSMAERFSSQQFKLQVGGGTVFGEMDFGVARGSRTPVIRSS